MTGRPAGGSGFAPAFGGAVPAQVEGVELVGSFGGSHAEAAQGGVDRPVAHRWLFGGGVVAVVLQGAEDDAAVVPDDGGLGSGSGEELGFEVGDRAERGRGDRGPLETGGQGVERLPAASG